MSCGAHGILKRKRSKMAEKLYPIFLKLTGKEALVVGGGVIAARKAKTLLDYGARVRAVMLEACEKMRALEENANFSLQIKAFETADIGEAALVIAATNHRPVNEAVKEAANAQGLFVNVVDVPDLCDFYVPSIVDRTPFQIAISTSGASPALARRTRKALEAQYPPAFADYIRRLGELRERAKKEAPEKTGKLGERLAAEEKARTLWLEGEREKAEALLHAIYDETIREENE